MATRGITWSGFLLRLLFAAILVFFTYNPSGRSYYHWLSENISSPTPLLALAGVLLLAITPLEAIQTASNRLMERFYLFSTLDKEPVEEAGPAAGLGISPEIYNTLVEQEVVYLTVQSDDLEQVHAERDYSDSGLTSEQIEWGNEDAVALVLTGEITGGKPYHDEDNDITQYDFTFSLRLIDTNKSRIVPGCTVQKPFRKIRED